MLMGIHTRLLAYLNSWVPKQVSPYPFGCELINFRCDGCMAHDWHELDRGVVVDRVTKGVYGSPGPFSYLVVKRADGSQFECYEPYCFPGEEYMQKHTDNPEETLVGKLVYTH